MEEKVTDKDIDTFMSMILGVKDKKVSEIKGTDEIPKKLNDNEDCNGREIPRTLVYVNYQDRIDKNSFVGRAYSYYTKLPLKVGDKVVCPTKYGNSVGRVCRIDVPEKEVESYKDALKEIDSYYTE